MTSLRPVILTSNLDGLARFYTALFGAVGTSRVPQDGGPAFYLGLRIGDSVLGPVADAGAGTARRMPSCSASPSSPSSISSRRWRLTADACSEHSTTCRGGSGWHAGDRR